MYSSITFLFRPTVSTCVDNVGKNRKIIAEYMRNIHAIQLSEDLAHEQKRIKEVADPFAGEPKASKNNQPL